MDGALARPFRGRGCGGVRWRAVEFLWSAGVALQFVCLRKTLFLERRNLSYKPHIAGEMARLRNSVDKSMFYGAEPIIFERARKMRRHQTEAEIKLWEILQNKKMMGLRFKRQHPISNYIADFYCHKIKLVVEVDGKIHFTQERKEYDSNRTAEMERLGIEVMRFTNTQVLEHLDEVSAKIEAKCRELYPSAT